VVILFCSIVKLMRGAEGGAQMRCLRIVVLIRAHTPRHQTISCKGQTVEPEAVLFDLF